MKIASISIKNFRSLKDTILKDLGDLVVIIGPNSSGKTSFMEALAFFFAEFDPTVTRTVSGLNEYLWFDRDHDNPIVFDMTLDVRKNEMRFTDDVLKVLETKPINSLQIIRLLVGSPSSASWVTYRVALNDKLLIEAADLKSENIKLENWPSGKTPPSKEQLLELVQQGLSQTIKDAFRIVWALRNSTAPFSSSGSRESLLAPNAVSEIVSLSQARDRAREAEWRLVENRVSATEPGIEDVRTIGADLMISERTSQTRFPISLIGGGHQEVLSIWHALRGKKNIFGIEEPETHMHPQLARRFFTELKGVSKETQIILSTHSPVFVDMSDTTDTWIFSKKANETMVKQVRGPSELRELLFDLGIKPSDIFFSNGILFVEGETDKLFISTVARKMGVDFQAKSISLIPMRGKSTGKYHLEMWVNITSNSNLPFFMILDKDAKDEAEKLLDAGLLKTDANLFLLEKGSIEDYYPDDLLIDALGTICEIEEPDREKILQRPRSKSIEGFLKQMNKYTRSWKLDIAEKVAERVKVGEIDAQLKRIIESIRTIVETPEYQ